ILLLLDTIKTPIMVEVEFLFFLLSTMMGAYQMQSFLALLCSSNKSSKLISSTSKVESCMVEAIQRADFIYLPSP
ncbi:hypothetical protein, partial [Paenibacillus turicensis]|uniref:hypothetical protein n=1 Tax=Paenibacillus turicensis TaxID=160487 RepID=UPI001AE4CC32